MPVINRLAALHGEITAWRRDLHQNPELGFDLPRTSAFVADKLKSFGVDEIHTGIAKSGVVGVIRGAKSGSGKVIGLRADMDALPIQEVPGKAYSSQNPGKMHACGHDGHTAMLLGAAQYLAETRRFDGTVVLLFQPSEEENGGGRVMCEEGVMDRFGVQEVYGVHNLPGLPLGHIALREGPLMAAADRFDIHIQGRGGHGAAPHLCIDPVQVAAAIVQAGQSIVSRNADPIANAVVSFCAIKTGTTDNVIPDTAEMIGTARSFDPAVRDLIEERLTALVTGIAKSYGASARIVYDRGYPATVNHAAQARFAAEVARDVAGEAAVNGNCAPLMWGEDFSYMLEARPGAFAFLGLGDVPTNHHPAYDFVDDAIPVGSSYLARLAETAMPL